MDGNRRWAKNKNLQVGDGHQAGLINIEKIVKWFSELDIKYLTLFALSVENLNRTKEELDFLFNLFRYAILKYEPFFIENKIGFRIIGNLDIFDEKLVQDVHNLSKKTFELKPKLDLIIAFNYSGRQEIIETTKKLCFDVQNGKLDTKSLNEDLFKKNMESGDIPDPDIIIRTGREERVSNFLLWQLAYSELYFSDKNWPDFSTEDLKKILENYYQRNRNFGK
jgi:undecaprenyl diphosphate synthase